MKRRPDGRPAISPGARVISHPRILRGPTFARVASGNPGSGGPYIRRRGRPRDGVKRRPDGRPAISPGARVISHPRILRGPTFARVASGNPGSGGPYIRRRGRPRDGVKRRPDGRLGYTSYLFRSKRRARRRRASSREGSILKAARHWSHISSINFFERHHFARARWALASPRGIFLFFRK